MLESWDVWPPLAVFDLEHVRSSLRDHVLEGLLRNIFWDKRKVVNVSSLLAMRSQPVLHSASACAHYRDVCLQVAPTCTHTTQIAHAASSRLSPAVS